VIPADAANFNSTALVVPSFYQLYGLNGNGVAGIFDNLRAGACGRLPNAAVKKIEFCPWAPRLRLLRVESGPSRRSATVRQSSSYQSTR
jgi:hypothetical protein